MQIPAATNARLEIKKFEGKDWLFVDGQLFYPVSPDEVKDWNLTK